MPVSAADWARDLRSQPINRQPESQMSVEIVEKIFENHISPSEAAQALAVANEGLIRTQNGDYGAADRLWTIVAVAAIELGEDVTALYRLASTMGHMTQLPDIVNEQGTAVESPTGRHYWRDMPRYGQALRSTGWCKNPNSTQDRDDADDERSRY